MGNAFAILQVKAILSILLRRYDFELSEPDKGSDFHGLVVGPKEPVRMRYRRRVQLATATSVKTNGAATTAEAAVPVAAATDTAPPQTATTAPKSFRVTLDLDLCQGHAACQGEAPEVFKVSGLGKSRLLKPTPSADQYEKAKAAERYCPSRAIKVVDE
jgi:sterol 14-demethylase